MKPRRDSYFRNVKPTTENVRRNISNQRNSRRGFGSFLEFNTVNGLVSTVVQIGGIRINIPGGLIRNRNEWLLYIKHLKNIIIISKEKYSNFMNVDVLSPLFSWFLRPTSSNDIIGRRVFDIFTEWTKIKRNSCKLASSAALKEKNLVVVWDAPENNVCFIALYKTITFHRQEVFSSNWASS